MAKFTNELGGRMTVKVKNAVGERPKPNGEVEKYRGVSMSITNADATTEWMITKEEAKQLSAALSSFLMTPVDKVAPPVDKLAAPENAAPHAPINPKPLPERKPGGRKARSMEDL